MDQLASTPTQAPDKTTAPAKTLVIAEKRSVGRTIAQFLGCTSDHGSWIEGATYDVTWAQGHLLRLLMPDEYDAFPQWRTRDVGVLPLIPPADGWLWQVSSERGADAQYQVLAGLAMSGRYARIVNACDPDREGQCIADLALWYMGCRLPVDRLWCSSLEDAALAKAFKRMKPNSEYRGLFQSAVARSKADWLYGMNASRLYSMALRSAQSVGRVRTPTLALVVERDRQIEAFKASSTYRITLDLGDGFTVTGEPHANAATAKDVLARSKGSDCSIDSVERKRAREGAPTLLNTTGAQKLASERLGMAPDAVDKALQSLYEKKLATYPRTDSRYVNTEDGASLPALVAAMSDADHVGASAAKAFGALTCDCSKVVDDSKVEGHGALLPTRQLTAAKLAALPPEEAAIARMLCQSLLEAVSPDRVYDHVAVKATCQGFPYTASSTSDVDKGWKKLRAALAEGSSRKAGADDESGDDGEGSGDDATRSRIPADLVAPSTMTVIDGKVKTVKARPPKRYTDATLLAAMEHADRFLTEDELKAALKDSSLHSGGIGTPATRAGIIGSLVDRGYLVRKGSTLTSSQDARALVDEVVPELTSVELTAIMERDLTSIARGEAEPAPFMAGIEEQVRRIVAEQLARPVRTPAPKGEGLGTCPVCGGEVVDTGNVKAPYLCVNTRRERVDNPDGTVTWNDCGRCGFRLSRTCMGVEVTNAAARKLLAGKPVMLKGLQRKDGTKVDRYVTLDPERGWSIRIADDQRTKVGVCPKCGRPVYDVGNERVPLLCEANDSKRPAASAEAGVQPASCDFALHRTYLGKKLTKSELSSLLKQETVLLKGLTSPKTGNRFDANVALNPEFDWRPRIVDFPAQCEATRKANERNQAAAAKAAEAERKAAEAAEAKAQKERKAAEAKAQKERKSAEAKAERERKAAQKAERDAAKAKAAEAAKPDYVQDSLPGFDW